MTKRIYPALALAVLIACSGQAARANLISDGDFAADTQNFYAAGSTVGAWTVTGDAYSGSGIDLSQTDWQAPPAGGGSVDLDGFSPGGITQSFATVAGQTYAVSFYLAGNPDGNNVAIKPMAASAGDATQDFSFDTTSTSDSAMGYVLESFQFDATASTTTLSFTSLDSDGITNGAVVADIDVEAPEPASLALLTVGGLGIGVLRRRRAKVVARAVA
jgi:choice-of-anchor C domain-containing protein